MMEQGSIYRSDKMSEKLEEWKGKNLEIFLVANSPQQSTS